LKKGKLIALFKSNKKIVKNFSFLSILQFFQLIIGFLLFPYLIKVLGVKNYGIVIFAQAIIGYFLLILNYGFNITATKQIALHKNDKNKLHEIISSTYISKFIIFIFISILFTSMLIFVPFFSNHKEIYGLTFFSLIGWLLYPEWYFQGVEKMENITYIILTSKLISLVAIIIVVKEANDYYYVPIINSISMIISGIISVILLINSLGRKNITFTYSVCKIKEQLVDGSSIFLSNIVANTKDYFNTFIIGVFLNFEMVAVYDFANKIIRILIIPSSILYRVVFPKISIKKSFNMVRKLEFLSLMYSFLVILIIVCIPDSVLQYFFKNDIEVFKNTLYILSITLPLLSLSGSRGVLGLIAFNFDRYFTKGIITSMLFYCLIVVVLYFFDQISLISMSITLVFSLFVEVVSHSYYIQKKRINHA